MSAAADTALVRRFVEGVLVGGDFAVLAELAAVTCVDHAASAGQPSGLAGVAPLMIAWRAAFPDLAIAIEELVAEGDTVAVRSTGSAWRPSRPASPSSSGAWRRAGGSAARRCAPWWPVRGPAAPRCSARRSCSRCRSAWSSPCSP